ncbi:MAG TPA: hypothetical protein ENG47_02090 [Candidatus Aerophobetes bacterium]|uniref:Uncharacterized protein n=1 Tax=Aerophobetes bacterium TaxID=2030807 RepID=A0A7V0N0G3_UNCAE|nr:hypothetical protein [Candidatus Aerophobetes bacterium]
MKRLIKKLTLWGICAVLIGNGAIPAHARRIKGSNPLATLVGRETARLITELIDHKVPESLREQALDFSCTLIRDAKEASAEFPHDPSWSTESASRAGSDLNLSKTEVEKLASVSGFGGLYSFLQYVVPSLTASDVDAQSAFEIFREKYQKLNAELQTVQRSLTHRKDVINAGINLTFRYLFPDAIADSHSPTDLNRRLEEKIQDLTSVLKLEDQIVERVLGRLQQEEERLQQEDFLRVQEEVKYWNDKIGKLDFERYRENYWDFLKARITPSIQHLEYNGENYLGISFAPLEYKYDVFVKYSEENGYKKVTQIFIRYHQGISDIYYDITSFRDLEGQDELVTKIEEIINNLTIEDDESDLWKPGFFWRLDIKGLRELLRDTATPLTSKPLLLYLLSKKLKFFPGNGIAVRWEISPPDGFYHPQNGGVYIRSFNINTITHEVTHAVFEGLLDDDGKRKELEQAISDFKSRHRQFFDNISKRHYTHLEGNDLGKLNELIAYMMGALASGETSFPSFAFDENNKPILEPILVEDVEQLVNLGFLPDWARPSQLLGDRYEECRGKNIGEKEVRYLDAFYDKYVELLRNNPDLFGFVIPVFFAHLFSPCLLES